MKLCLSDPYVKAVECRVLACEQVPDAALPEFPYLVDGHQKDRVENMAKRYKIQLDQEPLYATEGDGEPGDTGKIGEVRCEYVEAAASPDARSIHWCNGPVKVGAKVTVEVDWDRRWQHMQSQTTQHLISAYAYEMWNRASFEMFEVTRDAVSVNFSVSEKGEAPKDTRMMASELEKRVNKAIRSSLPVTQEEVHGDNRDGRLDELDKDPLTCGRGKNPNNLPLVRFIKIKGMSMFPSGHMHVQNLAELQMVKIFSVVPEHDGWKVSFAVGDFLLSRISRMLAEADLTSVKTKQAEQSQPKRTLSHSGSGGMPRAKPSLAVKKAPSPSRGSESQTRRMSACTGIGTCAPGNQGQPGGHYAPGRERKTASASPPAFGTSEARDAVVAFGRRSPLIMAPSSSSGKRTTVSMTSTSTTRTSRDAAVPAKAGTVFSFARSVNERKKSVTRLPNDEQEARELSRRPSGSASSSLAPPGMPESVSAVTTTCKRGAVGSLKQPSAVSGITTEKKSVLSFSRKDLPRKKSCVVPPAGGGNNKTSHGSMQMEGLTVATTTTTTTANEGQTMVKKSTIPPWRLFVPPRRAPPQAVTSTSSHGGDALVHLAKARGSSTKHEGAQKSTLDQDATRSFGSSSSPFGVVAPSPLSLLSSSDAASPSGGGGRIPIALLRPPSARMKRAHSVSIPGREKSSGVTKKGSRLRKVPAHEAAAPPVKKGKPAAAVPASTSVSSSSIVPSPSPPPVTTSPSSSIIIPPHSEDKIIPDVRMLAAASKFKGTPSRSTTMTSRSKDSKPSKPVASKQVPVSASDSTPTSSNRSESHRMMMSHQRAPPRVPSVPRKGIEIEASKGSSCRTRTSSRSRTPSAKTAARSFGTAPERVGQTMLKAVPKERNRPMKGLFFDTPTALKPAGDSDSTPLADGTPLSETLGQSTPSFSSSLKRNYPVITRETDTTTLSRGNKSSSPSVQAQGSTPTGGRPIIMAAAAPLPLGPSVTTSGSSSPCIPPTLEDCIQLPDSPPSIERARAREPYVTSPTPPPRPDTPKDKVPPVREQEAPVAVREQGSPLFLPRNEVNREALRGTKVDKHIMVSRALVAESPNNEVARAQGGRLGDGFPKGDEEDDDEGELPAAHIIEEDDDEDEVLIKEGQKEALVESPKEEDIIMNERSMDDSLIDEVIHEQACSEVSPRNEAFIEGVSRVPDTILLRDAVIQKKRSADSLKDETGSAGVLALDSARDESSTVAHASNTPRIELSTIEQAPDCARNDEGYAGGHPPVFSPRIDLSARVLAAPVSPISEDPDSPSSAASAQSLPARLEDNDSNNDEGYAGEDYYYDYEPASETQAMTLTAEEYDAWVEQGYGAEFPAEQLEVGEQEQHDDENEAVEPWVINERTKVESKHHSVARCELEFLKTEIDRHWFVRQQGYDELEEELRHCIRNGASDLFVTTRPFVTTGWRKFVKFRQEPDADVLITVHWDSGTRLERNVDHYNGT